MCEEYFITLPERTNMRIQTSPATLIYFAILLLLHHEWSLLAIFSAIFVHEMTHLSILWILGGNVSALTITPMGLSIERSGLISHMGEFLLSLCAPLVNLILSVIYWHLHFESCIVEANLGFGLINLLPIYPLDGGKALRSLFQALFNSKRASQLSTTISTVSLIVFWMFSVAVALILNGGLSMLMLSAGLFITIAPTTNSNK